MSSVSSRRTALRARPKHGPSVALMLVLLSGCTVIQGDTAKLDEMKANPPAAAAPLATANTASVPQDANSLITGSIASAGIPVPLISPRHRDEVRVASIDPRAGIAALSSGIPLSQLAGVYLQYGDAMKIAEKSKLNTPKEVRRVLKTLRFSQPENMADGWYAVRGMAAAQSKVFAEGVRNEVRINGQAKVLASLEDADYVLRIPGASDAISSVMASAAVENDRLMKLRKRFIDTAFKFQKQKWGMNEPLASEPVVKVAGNDTRSSALARVLGALSPISEAQAYSTPVMTKILALGAREVIAAPIISISAGGKDETSTCLNWARLNLNQCVAAAHFPSEEAWCTGTHAIEEVRTCWMAAMPAPGATPR
ncbi:MAG: hypothetical protein K8R18_08155 [Parvibaculum sp.]|uniref:hypothetical protein n=1 Tax=Parvibaculum sp. TaxID=2024848 RepID=UPI0025F76469|nr:hypothetical protein [Parvibaculum sp.]MCE9649579.1 hypothetical protein [Parvibaculum sp.]